MSKFSSIMNLIKERPGKYLGKKSFTMLYGFITGSPKKNTVWYLRLVIMNRSLSNTFIDYLVRVYVGWRIGGRMNC